MTNEKIEEEITRKIFCFDKKIINCLIKRIWGSSSSKYYPKSKFMKKILFLTRTSSQYVKKGLKINFQNRFNPLNFTFFSLRNLFLSFSLLNFHFCRVLSHEWKFSYSHFSFTRCMKIFARGWNFLSIFSSF